MIAKNVCTAFQCSHDIILNWQNKPKLSGLVYSLKWLKKNEGNIFSHVNGKYIKKKQSEGVRLCIQTWLLNL